MTHLNDDRIVTNDEMIDAISRSGYLLESQISELLSGAGFFVEANQVIKDPSTGKSREIDLLAEYYSYQEGRDSIAAKIKFVFEIKNNTCPMVLMTSLKPTPNIEPWEGLREVVTQSDSTKPLSQDDRFFERLVGYKTDRIFTQYCSFKRKRDVGRNSELMAWHPEEFHEGLMKIIQYCDEEVASWEDRDVSDYFRDFLYLPVLVLGGVLNELEVDRKGKARLKKVKTSKLWYNYHWKDEKKSAIIWIVTRRGFTDFIANMIKVERAIEDEMNSASGKRQLS
jgi:hypothetical protein